MRIHRLTLRNYRGVEEATVEFAETGVTVVEGDNDIGKTSLGEAIKLILDYADNSTARAVRAVQPVGKDVGAEIELEATMGPYRFNYKKRFHRDQFTELQIHEPSPENLAGREAHNRVEKIFNESTDTALFRALWLEQGIDLQQADISDTGTLGAALDRAAGRDVAGEEEHSLYDRVEQEYKRYWTPTWQPNSGFKRYQEARDEAQSEVDRLDADLKELEGTVQSCASLGQQIERLEGQHYEQRKRVEQLEETRDSVDRKESAAEQLRLKVELAASGFEQAKQHVETRGRLKVEVENAESDWSKMQSQREMLAPSLESARRDFEETDRLWRETKKKADEADRVARLRQDDFEHHRNLLDLVLMKERRERIRDAQKQLRNAAAFLEGCEIDDENLEDIEEAQIALFQAQTKLEGVGARLKFLSRSSQDVEFDGVSRQLSPDQNHHRTVHPSLARCCRYHDHSWFGCTAIEERGRDCRNGVEREVDRRGCIHGRRGSKAEP